MSSRITQSQTAQQKQAGALNTQPTARSTATTSKLRTGNRVPTSSSGIQGGACQSEPPRSKPSFPAPSTILPSDSISVREAPTAASEKNRPRNGLTPIPGWNGKPAAKNLKISPSEADALEPEWNWAAPIMDYTPPPSSSRPIPPSNTGRNSQSSHWTPSVASRQNPPSSYQSVPAESIQRPAPSSRSTAFGGNTQNQSEFSVPSQPGTVRGRTAASTSRAPSQQLSGAPRSVVNNAASVPMDEAWLGYPGQSSARGHPSTLPQQPVGLNIGVPPTGEFHFHYNQVDNRQMTVNNNSSQNMTTNNNQTYNVDNSNHHNTTAPRGNTYNSHATNSGNSYTNVNQKATSVRQSVDSSNYVGRRDIQQPSESLPIRQKLYASAKKYSVNEWTDKVKVTHHRVPNDRPC